MTWLRTYVGRTCVRTSSPDGVAVMLVPQAMAYAMLAGLPPVVGLYASTVPLLAMRAWVRRGNCGRACRFVALVADACVGPAGTVAVWRR